MKLSVFFVLALSGTALAFQQGALSSGSPDDKIIADQLPSYPLDRCPVSKEKLGGMGEPLNFVYEGRLVRFCCKNCVAEFKKGPSTFIKEIDDAVIKNQKPDYPMNACPVSGKALASLDTAIDHVHGTRLVRFCCPDCLGEFEKDPAKIMAKVDAALIEAQKKTYPLKTCPISDKPIEGAGIDYLYGTRLVRFCCPKCPEAFRKDPEKTLKRLDMAAQGAKEAGSKGGY